ncbi:unnamed protein product [Moneuplotes crassus]|uniref:Uncharacterized protein n=1 Tax=Euplotes crassus TaxID=5936 RepID=A0AAD1XHJ9_EUPCR|nr:unnamed protein product [Moneuplotes crassus]
MEGCTSTRDSEKAVVLQQQEIDEHVYVNLRNKELRLPSHLLETFDNIEFTLPLTKISPSFKNIRSNLMKSILRSKLRMFWLEEIQFTITEDDPKANNKICEDFIKYCLPERIKNICFSSGLGRREIALQNYSWLPVTKVTNSLYFSELTISTTLLSRIFRSLVTIKRLNFVRCKISKPESIRETFCYGSVENISFHLKHNEDDPINFEILLNVISKASIKEGIKTILIDSSCIRKERLSELCSELNLKNLTIKSHSHKNRDCNYTFIC